VGPRDIILTQSSGVGVAHPVRSVDDGFESRDSQRPAIFEDHSKGRLSSHQTLGPNSRTSFDRFVRDRVPWMRPEDHADMLEGLRKAGWPET